MVPLFSEQGCLRFDEIVKPGLLCAFDFDGTLAPIVAQPDMARLPDDIGMQLEELSCYAPVAIISGRSMDDLSARICFSPDFAVGNHGIEGLPGWERQAQDYRKICLDWFEYLTLALHDDQCILIEDKRYSLSVHYRWMDDTMQVERRLLELFSCLEPKPRVITGKYVFNLLPQGAIDKGDAIMHLMQLVGANTAFYAGDDVTDEDVFRLRRHDLLSVRVEPSAESRADFCLPHQQEMSRLIQALTQKLRLSSARNWIRLPSASNA